MRIETLTIPDFYTCPNTGPLENPDCFSVRQKPQAAAYPEFYYQQDSFVRNCYVHISLITSCIYILALCPSLPEKQVFSIQCVQMRRGAGVKIENPKKFLLPSPKWVNEKAQVKKAGIFESNAQVRPNCGRRGY